jgi:hypothetical protein
MAAPAAAFVSAAGASAAASGIVPQPLLLLLLPLLLLCGAVLGVMASYMRLCRDRPSFCMVGMNMGLGG